jgi:TRAP-type uncharacterized transport system substrate-binding protein
MIYRVANDRARFHRIVLMTTESIIRDHIIAAPGIKSVQDLKGKRLGYSVPGAVTHVGAVGFAKKMGWEPGKDITLVGGGNALNPLSEGKEDALLASGMLFAMASERKFNDLIDLTQYKIPVAGSSILAEKNWLAANRDTAARFVRAAVEADALMKTNRRRSTLRWSNGSTSRMRRRRRACIARLWKFRTSHTRPSRASRPRSRSMTRRRCANTKRKISMTRASSPSSTRAAPSTGCIRSERIAA